LRKQQTVSFVHLAGTTEQLSSANQRLSFGNKNMGGLEIREWGKRGENTKEIPVNNANHPSLVTSLIVACRGTTYNSKVESALSFPLMDGTLISHQLDGVNRMILLTQSCLAQIATLGPAHD
jgi:hypothetical protein